MKPIELVQIALTAIFFVGCDYIPSRRQPNADEDAARQREAEKKTLRESANTLERYLAERIVLVENTSREDAAVMTAVRADSKAFAEATTRILGEKTSKGVALDRETQLLHLLKDDVLNDLARKYLNVDFSLMTSRYVAEIKDARAQESLYRRKLQESETRFAESVDEVKKWATATEKQREEEIERLRKEIRGLEQRREKYRKDYRSRTRRTLNGSQMQRIEQHDDQIVSDMKIDDVEQEINKKRGQIDYLRNPHVLHGMSNRPMVNTQSFESRASDELRRWQQDIDRRLKPKVSSTDIAAKYENESVTALQRGIAARLAEIEKRTADSNRKTMRLKELKLSVTVSTTQQELQKIRDEAVKL